MEIILIILGIIVFILSFLLPAGKNDGNEDSAGISEEAIKEMVGREVEGARNQISEIVDETIGYAMEKTERSMERMTNEKMMAVNEYSDTVLEQINKNHNEVVFLYDMLNDKHENLKTTVSEAAKTASKVSETLQDAEVTAKEVEERAKEVEERAKEAGERAREAEERAREAEERAKEAEERARETKEKAKSTEAKINEPEFIPISPERVEIIREIPVEAEEKKESEPELEPREAAEDVREVEALLDAVEEDDKRNNNERILELHAAGKSNMKIAKELGLGVGEVKLVIDLFEKK